MADWLTTLGPAIVAAAAGVSGAFVGIWGQQRNNAATARRAEEVRIRALVDRYQEPLIRAAFDLQWRLYNILDDEFLQHRVADADPRYGVDSTAWLFGQYFGWAEIVRREVQFLPSGGQRQGLQDKLVAISRTCATDTLDPQFRILWADQRALGEVMIVDGMDGEGRPRSDCMGYAAFVAHLDDPTSQVAPWFAAIRAGVAQLVDSPQRPPRLVQLQHALIDFVDLVDAGHVRFPKDRAKA